MPPPPNSQRPHHTHGLPRQHTDTSIHSSTKKYPSLLHPAGFFAIMSRSHVSNTTLSLGSTGEPATPQGKKMGERERERTIKRRACRTKRWQILVEP